MNELRGRVAVVTGAASGIGLALAEAFAAEGMRVVLADVDVEGMEAARKRIASAGAEAIAVRTDVSDPAQVDALRDAALEAFGAAHVICNNAGVAVGGQIWQVPLEAWHWVFGVNFWGVVHGVKSFVPLLIEQGEGHVVNTASAAGLMSTPYLGPYGCTKHAVVSLSETLFHELGGTDIGVSVLCPLWVKTRIHESDRNAPEGFAALSPVAGAPSETMRDIVAGLIASGLEPSIVAAKVVDAVKTNDFYVLPHDEVRGIARHRGETIAEGGKPSLAPLA